MTVSLPAHFESIAQRAVYGLRAALTPVGGTDAQRALHTKLEALLDALYAEPSLAGLPVAPDEAYDWYVCNNQRPELNKLYFDVYAKLNGFYRFLYAAAQAGEPDGGALRIPKTVLKDRKAAYKPAYAPALAQAGIPVSANRESVTLAFGTAEVAAAFRELGERSLFDFARCSFDGGFSDLPPRIDAICGLDGLLPELDARLRAEGCRVELRACFSGTAIGYDIVYLTSEQNTGFKITFNNRKKELWRFGLLSGVGEKAMLEDFERLDPALQALFLRICRPCSGCGGCTKSGKNARFTVTVQANGTSHALCPQFPQHEWQKPDRALADTLCLYLRTQLRYI